MKSNLTVFVLASLLGGCAVGPNYRPPATALPDDWRGPRPDEPTSQPAGWTNEPADVAQWWKTLHDPMLETLVARAVRSNPDLRLATARVREARALRDVATANYWPQINLGSSYAYRGSSSNAGQSSSADGKGKLRGALEWPNVTVRPGDGGNPATLTITPQRATFGGNGRPTVSVLPGALTIPGGASSPSLSVGPSSSGAAHLDRQQNLFQVGFDASWELDLFGGLRRSVEAAGADLGAIEENRRDVLVTVIAEVARNYVELRGAQRRLAIAEANIAAQRDTLELTQDRCRAGFTSELDVSQAAAQLATTRSQIPLLQSVIRQAIYQLSVLLGQLPGALVDELDQAGPIPTTPPTVPVGMPSELLRRRPDVRAAERRLAAATARVGVATADLFPKLALTASFGPQASDVRHILDERSLAWSLGPSLSWPIFDGGRIRANLRAEDARLEQALAQYAQAVLTAFQDVEASLVAYTRERERHERLAEAVASNTKAVELSNDLYTRGLGAFLNVLDSERALYASQDELVQSEMTTVANLIALYKALGGGWESGQSGETGRASP